MIKRISMLLAQKIVLENNEKDNEDIYAYGLEIIINSLISIISVLAIGILQHNFWYTVIYLTTYCSIRLYAGGYHAKNNFYCILIFVLAYMCSPIWNVLYCKFVTAFITLCIINLVVISWAPVDSLQNPILDSERLLLKKKAIGLTVIVSVLILCNVILRFSSHISGASVALTYIGIVVAVGKLKD